MGYKPLYNAKDVEIPAFLNEVKDIDFLNSYNRYQLNEGNDIKLAAAKREEEAKLALASLDMELEEDIRDKEIQKILASSGDLEGLGQYRESKAREEATKYMSKEREVKVLDALRNQPQDVIEQFLRENSEFGYEGMQSTPDKKFQNLGGTIAETSPLGDFNIVGETASSNRSSRNSSKATNGSKGYKTPKFFYRPTKDNKLEIVELSNEKEESQAREQGFLPDKMVEMEGYAGKKEKIPFILKKERDTKKDKIDFFKLSREEQKKIAKEYAQRGGTSEQFEAWVNSLKEN